MKNSIYTFWHKEYFYKDIKKVEIKPSRNIYMRVILKEQNKHVWDYVIDLVAPEDINELIEMIEAKNIAVDSTNLNLQIRYSNRNFNEKTTVTFGHDEEGIKTFRQSLWNTSLVKTNLIFTVIVTTLIAPFILLTTQSIWVCLSFVLLGYALFPIYFTRHFYVILSPGRLIIQNGVYSSSRKKYYFEDIAKVRITRGRNIHIQVFTKMQEDIPRRYCIDLVGIRDYKLLVYIIKAKGVILETEGLERYLN